MEVCHLANRAQLNSNRRKHRLFLRDERGGGLCFFCYHAVSIPEEFVRNGTGDETDFVL